MKKLRIAMYFSAHPDKAGGIQEHVFYLSNALKKLGHDVTIYGSAKTKRYSNYIHDGHVIELPMPNGNWSNCTIPSISKKPLSKIINSKKYDICHIHEPYTPFVSLDSINNVACSKITTFHAGWDKQSEINIFNSILPIFKNYFSKNVDGTIFVSKIAQNKWKSLCEKIVIQKIIYSGIDHGLFFPKNVKKNGYINLLYLARLVNRKGLHFLLKAFTGLIDEFPNIRLTVAGEGNERKKYESYVKKNHLSRYVNFTGKISSDKKIQYYQDADIFCVPYKDEGFGLTALEALSCGCAIAGFQNEAFCEWLSDYPCKESFVPYGNIYALQKAIRNLINNKKMLQKIKNWSIEKSKEYDWDKTAKETSELYQEIISRKQKSS